MRFLVVQKMALRTNRNEIFPVVLWYDLAKPIQPEGFYARLAVALATEKAAELGDLADDITNRWGFGRDGLLVQNIGVFAFTVRKQFRGRQFRMNAPHANQAGQSPGHDHVESQRQLDFGDATEL